MNLVELTILINHPEVQKDQEMLDLHIRMREQLIVEINADIVKLGLPAMTLKELLLASPSPHLAQTV